jgi:hypothetical protein
MALGMYFQPASFTRERYDEAIARLDQAGAAAPAGRKFHFAFVGESGGIEVFDVWDSMEDFEKFGETLVPIMSELGADPGQPQVAEIHNVILG